MPSPNDPLAVESEFPSSFHYRCPETNRTAYVTLKEGGDSSMAVYRHLPKDSHVFILICPACAQQHKVRKHAEGLTVETVDESSDSF
jgi:hypothetical protein